MFSAVKIIDESVCSVVKFKIYIVRASKFKYSAKKYSERSGLTYNIDSLMSAPQKLGQNKWILKALNFKKEFW